MAKKYRKTTSFDVAFSPMVNVTTKVLDPKNLTEDERERVADLAVQKVRENLQEKISSENLEFIRIYKEDARSEDDVPVVWPTGPHNFLERAGELRKEAIKSIKDSLRKSGTEEVEIHSDIQESKDIILFSDPYSSNDNVVFTKVCLDHKGELCLWGENIVGDMPYGPGDIETTALCAIADMLWRYANTQ